ncbi:MAG TPA: deoxyribonuclease IV [Thermoleophilaceae bacterium]|nr:deoxyribonuclease IV [Thermoleophilaceae bacterium]
MLIGAHVSTAGGLVNAWERGRDMGCDAIQVFNQSPRQWRPTRWKDDDIAEFRELMADGPIKSVVIHAVYLINCASKDEEIRSKSIASLVHSLQMGDAIGADGVVLHPGSTVGEPHGPSMKRVGKALEKALAKSDSCPLLLEDTAGAGNTIGRTFEELGELVSLAGGGKRVGICLDSCHLLASGYDVRTADGVAATMDECEKHVGRKRLRCLHVNDSKMPLASNRDRHAPLGTGELGARGCGAFLSEPRFEKLPALFEGPGFEGNVAAPDIKRMRELRRNGQRARKRRS